MKRTLFIVILAVLVVSGAVLGYLFLGRGGKEGESETAPREEVKVGEQTAESNSIYFAKRGGGKELGHVGPSALGLSHEEYAKLMAMSRKLGAIPNGEQPVMVEDFDYLTIEETPESKALDAIERLVRVVKEAQKQKFLVAAQPYIIVRGFVSSKPEEAKREVAIPVVKTSDPKPPLILRHARIGRAFVSEVVPPQKDEKGAVEKIAATIERAKRSGGKVSDTVWLKVETEDWTKKRTNECPLRAVVPIE
jgi:hypothetical protein